MIRLFAVTGCLVFSLVAMGCESSSDAPTTPSPAPAPTPPPPAPTPPPTPTPAPPPAPAAPAALSELTLSSTSVPGQSQPTGTVRLTAPAPSGGAVIRLESDRTLARVPSSVTVAAGQTTATFTVDTSTVDARADVILTATYADVAKRITLTVLLPRPRAVFTVTSPAFGQDACVLIQNGLELDCRLDGKTSEGRIVLWTWLLEARERIRADRPDPGFNEIDTTCRLIDGASSSSDSNGNYVDLKVTLEVTDKEGDQNTSVRTVKLYTNKNCGY